MKPTIGFVGLGMMGRPLAERIAKGGYDLIIFDLMSGAMEPFLDMASAAGSPAEVGDRADIVFACLPTLASYESAVMGGDGIVHSKRARTYVHAGTTGAPLLRKLAPLLEERGIVSVDAPVTGGVARARAGTLTSMTAGPRDAVQRVEPVIRTYSSTVIHMGELVGGAQTMKCVNNVLSATNLAIACEAIIAGAKAGLDPSRMLEVINAGSGQNSATLLKLPQHVLTRKFAYEGRLAHLLKDVNAFLDEAHELDSPCSISEAVQRCYVATLEQDDGRADMDYDVTEVILPMERAAGIEIRESAVDSR